MSTGQRTHDRRERAMSDIGTGFSAIPQPADGHVRMDAPAFHRNHDPIWSVIGPWLTQQDGDALEIGSGSGQHIVEFARKAPRLTWWPSDILDAHLRSIEAWGAEAALRNLQKPQILDLTDADWRPCGIEAPLTAIVCINVLHIAPWSVSENLLSGAARLLRPGGRLFVYGPFMRDGVHTAPSNASFDASLRARNPEWGVRDMAELAALAARHGLSAIEATPMPANNFVLTIIRG
jgi:SAM-dependent methyltransferase